jgi:hypothetical protein
MFKSFLQIGTSGEEELLSYFLCEDLFQIKIN